MEIKLYRMHLAFQRLQNYWDQHNCVEDSDLNMDGFLRARHVETIPSSEQYEAWALRNVFRIH